MISTRKGRQVVEAYLAMVRATDGEHCPECRSAVYIHPPSQTWGCSNLECKATGSVEQLGRWR